MKRFIAIWFLSLVCIYSQVSLAEVKEQKSSDQDKSQQSRIWNYKGFSEKELNSIRESNNPDLIMGAGIVTLAGDSKSKTGIELLILASKIESPKGMATISLISHNLNLNRENSFNSKKENIVRLLKDNKDNALSYYFNALLLQEQGEDKKALEQINKGNTYKFSGYTKQKYDAILYAAEMAKWSGRHSRQLALYNSNSTIIYFKLRHLCRNLKIKFGQEDQDACMNLGRNLEEASLTCLDRISSLGTQIESLDDSPPDDVTRSEIKKKGEIALACGGCESIFGESDVSEEVDKKYYEIYLDKGEASARKYICDFVNQKQQGN